LGFKASANVSAVAGLDEPTRTFISGLAPQVRTQVLQLLQDALPLLDTSVLKYIAAVNNIVDKQINHLECAIVCTGKIVGADLRAAITFTSDPQPVADLSGNRDKTIKFLNLPVLH
jgi:hypothetical protein